MPTTLTSDETYMLQQLGKSIDPDAVWLRQFADVFNEITRAPLDDVSPVYNRLRGIATKLLIAMQDKPKPIDGPKCQYCGDPMHKGVCPRVKAFEFDTITHTVIAPLKRVEFFDSRTVRLEPAGKMSEETLGSKTNPA